MNLSKLRPEPGSVRTEAMAGRRQRTDRTTVLGFTRLIAAKSAATGEYAGVLDV